MQDLTSQSKAQALIASAVSGLENLIEKNDEDSADICFSIINSLSGSDIDADEKHPDAFEQYKTLAPENSTPYNVAQALQDIINIGEKEELLVLAVEKLVDSLPKENNRPYVNARRLATCIEILKLKTETIKSALPEEEKVIFYDEKTAEKIVQVMENKNYGLIDRMRAGLGKTPELGIYEEEVRMPVIKGEPPENIIREVDSWKSFEDSQKELRRLSGPLYIEVLPREIPTLDHGIEHAIESTNAHTQYLWSYKDLSFPVRLEVAFSNTTGKVEKTYFKLRKHYERFFGNSWKAKFWNRMPRIMLNPRKRILETKLEKGIKEISNFVDLQKSSLQYLKNSIVTGEYLINWYEQKEEVTENLELLKERTAVFKSLDEKFENELLTMLRAYHKVLKMYENNKKSIK